MRISGSNAGYTMFRGSLKSTGYPFHSPVSPTFPLPCVTVCHHISTAVYDSHQRQQIFLLSKESRTTMEPKPPPTHRVPSAVLLGEKRPWREADLHIAPILKMCAPIPPIPHMSSGVGRDTFTFTEFRAEPRRPSSKQ